MMIFKIAWRNIWRNKRRSLIVLASIVVGVTMLILNDSFGVGMMQQMLNNQIESHVTHVQIHRLGFDDNKTVQDVIPDPNEVEEVLSKSDFVENYSKRVVVFGLLSSAYNSSGISIIGIEPEQEAKLTRIKDYIVEGTYLTGAEHEVLMSVETAEKLEVELGDKIVGVAADAHGEVSSELFRVIGLYKSSSTEFDKGYCYVPLSNAQKMLNLGDSFHEFAMIVKNPDNIVADKDQLLSSLNDKKYEVLSYQDLLPMMMSYIQMYDQMIIVFYGVILLAVLFGVINTMLMSVFERVQEFGVLMSIGMKNRKLFAMVMIESMYLGILGTVFGFIVGVAIYYPLSIYGIDLSIYADSLDSFGIGSIIYPKLSLNVIANALLVMPFMTLIGAIWPARKALKLTPTDAMRYV